jgi:hypothetical protein
MQIVPRFRRPCQGIAATSFVHPPALIEDIGIVMPHYLQLYRSNRKDLSKKQL